MFLIIFRNMQKLLLAADDALIMYLVLNKFNFFMLLELLIQTLHHWSLG